MEAITDIKIDRLKPRMNTIPSFDALRITEGMVVQCKVDGEFTYLHHGERTYTVNRWGRIRTGLPALVEFSRAIGRVGINEVDLLCELYAVEGDIPLKLLQFVHYIKSGDPNLLEKVHIGVFDLVRLDGTALEERPWMIEEVDGWFEGCKLVGVLPYIKPKSVGEVASFWREYVEGRGYEGLCFRSNRQWYKVKPISSVDCVIIGINKLKLFREKKVTSLKLALMEENGTLVELSNVASGIDHQLREAFWKLMEFKVGEDKKTVYIKPMVVCEVQYTDTFESKNRKLRILIIFVFSF